MANAPPSPVVVHAVLLQPSGWTFDARADEVLLRAAARAGIRMPSSCRNGTCRACMCYLDEGRVGYIVERPGLSTDEKEEGWILPCVARAVSDLRIDAPGVERVDKAPPKPIMTGPRR